MSTRIKMPWNFTKRLIGSKTLERAKDLSILLKKKIRDSLKVIRLNALIVEDYFWTILVPRYQKVYVGNLEWHKLKQEQFHYFWEPQVWSKWLSCVCCFLWFWAWYIGSDSVYNDDENAIFLENLAKEYQHLLNNYIKVKITYKSHKMELGMLNEEKLNYIEKNCFLETEHKSLLKRNNAPTPKIDSQWKSTSSKL